jgi:hypothetical protein
VEDPEKAPEIDIDSDSDDDMDDEEDIERIRNDPVVCMLLKAMKNSSDVGALMSTHPLFLSDASYLLDVS